MQWLHEPPVWSESNDQLRVTTGLEGDYWRTTHYGFVHDNGHFAYELKEGEFTATLGFEADYSAQYDQAGLMLRLDEENWIKAGIEYVDGRFHFSVVVTREFSDWSIRDWPTSAKVWVRVTRKGDAVAVEASADGVVFAPVRLAYFPPDVPVMVGPMTCSPLREGLETRFDAVKFEPVGDISA